MTTDRRRTDSVEPERVTGHYVGSRPSRAATVVRAIVLGVACLLVAVPFLMVVMTSLADAGQIGRAGGLVLIPERPSLGAYVTILSGGRVLRSVIVSVCVTIVGTLLSLLVTTMLAYALARRGLLFGRAMLFLVLLTMLFSAGLIPVYLTVRALGLLDTYAALVLPVLVSAFNTVVMRSFFMALPEELTDSARIDGASELRIFVEIMIPLSKPILAAIGLFYAVGYWNSWFSALLYLNDPAMHPVQLVMRTYLVNRADIPVEALSEFLPPQPALQMAILVISLVPIACVYPFLQKYFTKGVLTGAVKG